MKLVLVAAVVLASIPGCSFLFQERLPSGYTGQTEPRCSTAPGWWLWDGLIAATDVGVLALDNDRHFLSQVEFVTFVASAVLHVGSMARGKGWADDCEEARDAYDNPQAARSQPAVPRPHRPEPKGWLCASSPSTPGASACARYEADCVGVRELRVAATPDLGQCLPLELAWCFQPDLGKPRCAPDVAGCEAQRAPVLASAVDAEMVGACVETR